MNFIQQNKFYLPEDAAHYIQRENLIDKFSKLSEYRIVLVSAGPGFGKSLSTANILEGMGQDFAWLSLSPEDDYFNRFDSP